MLEVEQQWKRRTQQSKWQQSLRQEANEIHQPGSQISFFQQEKRV